MLSSKDYRLFLKLSCLLGYLFVSNGGLYETIAIQIGHNSPAKMLFYSAYSFVFAALFIYFSFYTRGIWKLVAFLPFLASGISGQHYWIITGHPITIDAIEMALINTKGAAGFVNETFDYMLFALATASIGILGIALPVASTPFQNILDKPIFRRLSLGLAVIMFLGTSAVVLLRNGYGMTGMPVQVSSLFPLPVTQFSSNFTREDRFIFQHEGSNSIVVVIDESVSYRHMKKVARLIESETFPALANAGQIMPIIKTAEPFHALHNCSAQSVWGIINGLRIQNGNIILGPSLWELSKKAGYKTVYISAQESPSQHQYMQTPNDLAHMDERYYFGDLTRTERDRGALGQVLTSLNGGEKVFIFVVKNGSHFPYEWQIPSDDMTRYLIPDGINLKERAYLTSIYRNTFRFLGDLLTNSAAVAPMIFYTSDHGQNLLTSGFAHCNSADPQADEWEVPLLTHNVPSNVTGPMASNTQLHSSIARAMGYDAPYAAEGDSHDVMLYGSVNTRIRSQINDFKSGR